MKSPITASLGQADAGAPARLMPPANAVVLPEEVPVLKALVAALAKLRPNDAAAQLAQFDKALAALPGPTPLRGRVQVSRAPLLQQLRGDSEAVQAAESGVELLPGYSGPLLVAAHIYLYANRPQQAADAILRASAIDPASIRLLDDYEINGVLRRLEAINDRRTARLFSERLLTIGWVGKGVQSRSALAKVAIGQSAQDGDLAHARGYVPYLTVPKDAYELLTMADYQPIWADIEASAGLRLERQWPAYLNEARARWEAGHDLERAVDYATALREAGDYQRLIDTFLPLLMGTPDRERDWPLVFLVAPVTNALLVQGRIDQAIGVFDHAARTWPIGSSANALNISLNRGNALLSADRPAEALAQFDVAIADSRKWGAEVNSDARAQMHLLRACALHALQRDGDAAISAAIAAGAGHARSQARVRLCMDDLPGARAALIAALSRPDERDAVLALMQPDRTPTIPTDYGRRERSRGDALRSDPQLRAAIAAYGRILPFAVNDAAPGQAP
ncbi:hypothetical protein [Sphingomonas crusticola]|uniref:hypothetical protein n=1 Tax=Sphingomonas crusticola TaxID=1697973 RepID=UPI000E238153|nr:hypothetical protein [Sphingomonas crusticola]